MWSSRWFVKVDKKISFRILRFLWAKYANVVTGNSSRLLYGKVCSPWTQIHKDREEQLNED
jgi:hypothetical protein